MDHQSDAETKGSGILRTAAAFDRFTREAAVIVLGIMLLFMLSSLADIFSFSARGTNGVRYRSMSELSRINPDIVAWLRIKGTKIDGPVVQGKDNSEYLDLDFYGHYYAGGTLFLDVRNDRDFADDLNIIHGHHMAGGAMFGDLHKFTDKTYFDRRRYGELITRTRKYELEVISCGVVSAYDNEVYDVNCVIEQYEKVMKENAVRLRDTGKAWGKLLMLSTCTSDMDDTRTVVYLWMTEKES